jgi:hypothetical protein
MNWELIYRDLAGRGRSTVLGCWAFRVDEWGLLDWATCTKYRVVRSVRVVRSEDRFEHNNFGLQIFLPKILIGFFGFGLFGFGLGHFGFDVRLSVFLPTPNPIGGSQ